MTEHAAAVELRGYMTEVAGAVATIRQPCAEHWRDGWLEEAMDALEHGWPEGHPGGPWDEGCHDCQQMPALRFRKVLDWHTNDPHVVGVTEDGEAILIHNPMRRWLRRLTRGRRHRWQKA